MPDASGIVPAFLGELRSTGAPCLRLIRQASSRRALEEVEAAAAGDLDLLPLLRAWHQEAADDLGGPPLEFDENAARQGATLLFRATWFYLHRDSTPADIAAGLAGPAAGFAGPAAVFSADLTLQYLPALFRLAQALAPGDALLPALRRLAAVVPLSAIGLPPEADASPPHLPCAIRQHPGLWQLFLDRAASRPDRAWLAHPDVSAALQETLGSHVRTLAPALDFPVPPVQPADSS